MSENNLLTAQDARELGAEARLNIHGLLQKISLHAKDGSVNCLVNRLDDSDILSLEKLGYTVQHLNLYDEISW